MTALGLVDQSGEWPTSSWWRTCAPGRQFSVVDNCEHLLDGIAVLADVLLKEAPGVRLLATSRQPLGISASVWSRCRRSPWSTEQTARRHKVQRIQKRWLFS